MFSIVPQYLIKSLKIPTKKAIEVRSIL